MIDIAASALVLIALVVMAATYAARVAKVGAAHFARVDKDGGSPLLGRGAMEMGYWALAPLGRWLARIGVTASMISWASLVVGVFAAIAAGTRHFGLAALLACISALGDMLDGMVARDTGTASEAGELLDVAVDRYVESAFLIGVAVAFRANVVLMVLALLAMVGGWFVTYTTAKGDAMRAEVPRGAMRRPERAVYLIAGAAFTPLCGSTLPMIAAVALVAAAANASAIRRFVAIARTTGARGTGTTGRTTLVYGSPPGRRSEPPGAANEPAE